MEVKGYKVFEPDWTCRGFQYEVGQVFEEDVVPECCERGFHFCKDLKHYIRGDGCGSVPLKELVFVVQNIVVIIHAEVPYLSTKLRPFS